MINIQQQILYYQQQNIPIRKLNKTTSKLYQDIIDITSNWSKNTKIKERVYVILNNITQPPICSCGKFLQFLGSSTGYRKYCSVKCRGASEEWKDKQTQTFLKKYNVARPSQNPSIHVKMEKSTLNRHGVKFSQQSSIIKEKTKNTNVRKYGNEHFTNTEQFLKAKQQTLNLRYKGRSPKQNHISNISWNILNNSQNLVKLNQNKNLTEIADYLNVSISLISRYFQKHKIIPISHYNCSFPEQEIKNFIQSIGIKGIYNSRNILPPKELDIYIPSHNIAIEFCGLYWHSDIHERIDQFYHYNKMIQCQEKGISLLTIFEDEWYEKGNIIKNMLKHKLHQHSSTFARNCEIVKIDLKTKKNFFSKYHIQGSGGGSITYGLMYNNELVSCMTFINRKNGLYELNRFASKESVVGGFSKLLNYFKQTHEWKEIVSFADRRFSNGAIYKKSHFVLENISDPSYYYVINKTRFHRRMFMKKSLPKYLLNFDPNLTEKENIDNHNIHRIWDCGQLKFKLINKENS